jgi:hypothetical protein
MLKKKFLTPFIALAIVFTFGVVTPVKALTVAELQAEIDSLLRILAGLQAQLVLSSYHIPENVLNKNLSSYSSVTAFVDDLASSTATSTNGSATTSTAQPIINVVKAMTDLGMTITDMSSEYGAVGALVNSIVATGDPADVKDLLVAIKNLGGTYSSLKTSIGGVKGLFTTIQQNLGSKRLPYLTGLLEDLKAVGGTWADVTIDSGFSSLKALIIKLSKKDNLEDLAAILAKLAELQKKYDDLYASSTKLYQLVAALDKHNDPLYDRCYRYTNRNSGNYYPSSSYYDPCRANDYQRYGLSPFVGDLARPLAGNRNPQSAFSTNPRNYGSGSSNPLAGRPGNPAGSTGFSTNPQNYGSGSGNPLAGGQSDSTGSTGTNNENEIKRIDRKTIQEVYDCKIAEAAKTTDSKPKDVEKEKKVKVYLVDKSEVLKEESKSTKSTALFNFTRRLLASAAANASQQAPATKVQQPLYIVEYPGISQNTSMVKKTVNGKTTYYGIDYSTNNMGTTAGHSMGIWEMWGLWHYTTDSDGKVAKQGEANLLGLTKDKADDGDIKDVVDVISSLAIKKDDRVNYSLYPIPIKLKECATSSDPSKKTTDSAQDDKKFNVESARLIKTITHTDTKEIGNEPTSNNNTQQTGTQPTNQPTTQQTGTQPTNQPTTQQTGAQPTNPSNNLCTPDGVDFSNMDSAGLFAYLSSRCGLQRIPPVNQKSAISDNIIINHYITTTEEGADVVDFFVKRKAATLGDKSYWRMLPDIPGFENHPIFYRLPSETVASGGWVLNDLGFLFFPGFFGINKERYYFAKQPDANAIIDFWDIIVVDYQFSRKS